MDPNHLNHPADPEEAGWHATTAEGAIALGRSWLLSPAFSALVDRLGGPGVTDPDRDLPALLAWSAATLDTRAGKERHDAPLAALSSTQIAALIDAAGPLGLLRTHPPRLPGYDITVILGGTVIGNELRVRLVQSIVAAGTRLGTLVALTAERPLSPAEGPSAGYRNEAEHLIALLTDAFGGASYGQDRTGEQSGPVDIQVLIARPSRPGRRANTSDAVAELSRRMPPADRHHILAVTSAIYVPYQFLVIAPALLSAGTRYAEIVGTPTATDGRPGALAQRLAQEVHAAITTMARHYGHWLWMPDQ
jgi:hypothetical protein